MAARTKKKGRPDATAGKARSTAGQRVRDVFEAAQETVHSRLDTAREQAGETWDNLEGLFQSRVHRALQQIGVPSAEEVRLLTQRVAELNESVKALAAGSPGGAAKTSASRGLARKAPGRRASGRKPQGRAR